MTDTRLDKFLPFVGVIGLILVWYIGYWMRIVDPVLLPPPDAAFKALWKGMTGGRLLFDFWQTVIRTFTAIAVAAVIAIPLGIVLGASERLYRSVEFVVDFFRSTPASAMFPLFLVIFGVGNATIMVRHLLPNAMVATLTFLPFILSGSITTLTSLDFLGFGMPPGSPSLGELIAQGKQNLQAPWLGLTAFAIMSLMLSLLIFVGEATRDAFDPRKTFR